MMQEMDFEIPSLNEIYNYLIEIANTIKKRNVGIDLVVGIARGGIVPARFLSDLLLIPDIKIISAKYYAEPGKKFNKPVVEERLGRDEVFNKRILLVDDVADTGETLIEVRNKLIRMGASRVYIAVIYIKPWNKASVDFFAKQTTKWIVFPWEFMETAKQLKRSKSWAKFLKRVREKGLEYLLNNLD